MTRGRNHRTVSPMTRKPRPEKPADPPVRVVPIEELPTITVGGLTFRPLGPAFEVPTGSAPFDSTRFYASLVSWVMTGEDPPALPPSESTTADDFQRAREVFGRLAIALFAGDKAVLGKLRTIEALLRDLPVNETEKLAHYRDKFSYLRTFYRDVQNGVWPSGDAKKALATAIGVLAETYDPAFAKLSVSQLEKAFEGVSEKRGPGETREIYAAAELAVHVGAFGADPSADRRTAIRRMISRLRKATSEAPSMRSKRKALRRS